jgi:hypothetical protein
MRRWRLTSAATADSASDQRSGVFTCWRGNAAGLGGWTFVMRISLATLQATGMAFFGLYGSTSALATTRFLCGEQAREAPSAGANSRKESALRRLKTRLLLQAPLRLWICESGRPQGQAARARGRLRDP